MKGESRALAVTSDGDTALRMLEIKSDLISGPSPADAQIILIWTGARRHACRWRAGQGGPAGGGRPEPPRPGARTCAAPHPPARCQPDDGMPVGPATDTTGQAGQAGGTNNPAVSREAPMSQLTSPVFDSADRPGRLRIRYRLRRAAEMTSARRSPELQLLAFSRYYSAGPAPF